MQGGSQHQPPGRRLWLFAGTGEGPFLAAELLRQGWRLRVSVVTAEAARAYGALEGLEVAVGALEGPLALCGELERAAGRGEPFALVVDATHPFALQIKATLAAACSRQGLPLLRLQRPHWTPQPASEVLGNLDALGRQPLTTKRLLLAIGGRQLGAAVAASRGALHHARLLPSPFSLQQAMAAGLAPERVACLRPTASGAIESALVRHWGIDVILARQSGGEPERLWHAIARRQGCRLLLLERPAPTAGPGEVFSQAALLQHLAQQAHPWTQE